MLDDATAARRPPRRAVAVALVVAALVAGATVVLAVCGTRAWVIESPSMGAAAPVGSLVITTSVPPNALQEGDVVAFQPPSDGVAVHVHRVLRGGEGLWWTRGDVNAAQDPWPLNSSTLVGRAVVILPAAGFAVRALPVLVVAALGVGVGATRLPVAYRGPVRLGVCSAALLATTAVAHPWSGAVPVPSATGRSIAVVSTGLLPQHVDVVSTGAFPPNLVGRVDLHYGQVATITVPDTFAGMPLQMQVRPAFTASRS